MARQLAGGLYIKTFYLSRAQVDYLDRVKREGFERESWKKDSRVSQSEALRSVLDKAMKEGDRGRRKT